MSTVPASLFVNVRPGVLAAGGSGVDIIGLMLTESTRPPIGTVPSFPDPASVQSYFGLDSTEAAFAAIYFLGYNNSKKRPGALLFAQYPASAVAAFLRGGNVGKALTLAQLQALSGSLNVVMDGYAHAISSISFSSDNSFSAAAAAITAAFTDPTEATFTASIGSAFTASGSGTALTVSAVAYGIISVGDTVTGAGIPANTTIISGPSNGLTGAYVTSQATTASTASCAGLSTVLDVTIDTDHAIAVGQTVVGSGVTGSPIITAQISGTGGVGTYRISGAQQTIVPPESMTAVATAPVVTYDSVSGAFIVTSGVTGVASTAAFATGSLAASLLLTSATGAVVSQGAAATTPAAFMAGIVGVTQNWATFTTLFDPDGGMGNTLKKQFADWVNTTEDQFAYVSWDTDVSPTTQVPATQSLGYYLQQSNDSGTFPIYDPSAGSLAAFVMGAAASIDFTRKNGRVTFAYLGQTGLVPSVTDSATFVNLCGNPQSPGSFGNGYNCYAAVATADQNFQTLQRGTVSGPFEWFDSYINQIWLNSQFQVSIFLFLTQIGSMPYNPAGYALLRAACSDTIKAAGNFGIYRSNVTLSDAQVAEVNNAAGVDIAGTLQTQGWYLQIQDAAPSVRQSRGSPPITFWYTDGESIQAINLASINVQ